jgi:prophage maintenance system killer protein
MTVELPIFNDNLKSSGSWTSVAAQAQAQWAEARAQTLPTVRAAQIASFTKDADAAHAQAAAELVTAWSNESNATFNLERLLALQHALTGADTLRTTEPQPVNAVHDPTPAVLLPRFLDNAFDWFSTEGFADLHAIEQAAVVYLRLLDLHPFPTANEAAALLAASFYVERAGWPPLFVSRDDITTRRFDQVVETGMRMLTQPLVEFFAEMLQRAATEAAP